MALSFSVTGIPIKNSGGRRWRLVAITFDALYVNGTGWTVQPSDVQLTTKVEGMTAINVEGYQLSPAISGNNAVLKAWKGNTEAGNNEAGINGLVGLALVWGR